MAIESFAESLLADVRKQNRQRQSEREKEQRKLLLASIGVGLAKSVGNELLKQQTEQFMQSESFRSARQVARTADNNAADIMSEWGNIEGSKEDPFQYMFNKYKPLVEEEMKAKTADWMENKSNYDAVVYNRTKQIATEQLERLREARSIIEDGGLGQDEKRLAILAKDYRPETVRDYITGRMIGFFKGKNQSDMDKEEILALKSYADDQSEGSRGYYAKQLKLIKEEYDRSGDLAASKIYADNMMFKEPKPEERFFTEEKTEVKTVGSSAYTVTVTNTYDTSLPGGMDKPIKSESKISGTAQDLRTEEEIVKAGFDSFDYMKWINDNFTEEARSLFMRELTANDVSISKITTAKELDTFEKIFHQFADDSMSYENKRADQFYQETIKAFMASEGTTTILDLITMPQNTQDEIDAFNAAKLNFLFRAGSFNKISDQAADFIKITVDRGE